MNPSNAQTSMQVYASDNDQYKSSPTEDQIRAGVVPLDTLPAAWWNYYWSMVTSNNNASKLAIDNIRTEIINVLTAAGVTPTADQTNQLLNSILAIHRKAPYFEATGDAVAGSVISSSDIKSISVNSETGKVTVNALADWEGTDTIKESLPTIATAEKAGLVKSSDDMTAVSVASDGVMTPNALADYPLTKTIAALLFPNVFNSTFNYEDREMSWFTYVGALIYFSERPALYATLHIRHGKTTATVYVDFRSSTPTASITGYFAGDVLNTGAGAEYVNCYWDSDQNMLSFVILDPDGDTTHDMISYSVLSDARVTRGSSYYSDLDLPAGLLIGRQELTITWDGLSNGGLSATYARYLTSGISTLVTADNAGNLKAHTLELT